MGRKLLFIVGMHRSGTSALCSALRASGATFGSSLLQAMSGVNDEGFWEDIGVVDVNEQLLHLLNTHWYTVSKGLASVDWSADIFSAQRLQAMAIVERGFGGGALEAVKDPRLCLTLPFWLSLCKQLEISASVCVINRAPLEIARSLEKRDGFPLGYGLRLNAAYLRLIAANTTGDTIHVTYNQLLQDPLGVMLQLAESLPLSPQEGELAKAVRTELKHQDEGNDSHLLANFDSANFDLDALDVATEEAFPMNTSLQEFALALVRQSAELTRVGEQHSVALTTLSKRDATLEEREATLLQLGKEHSQAQSTLVERDEQITVFDRRLADVGNEHSHALEVIAEKDRLLHDSTERATHFENRTRQAEAQLEQMNARLARILKLPVIGYIYRKLWFYERR